MRFRTRTQEVEAVEYTGDNATEVMSICTVASAHSDGKGNEWIEILDGFKRRLKVYAPALLLCDKRGDWWHSDPEWFENTYEPIPDLIRTVADYEGTAENTILQVESANRYFQPGDVLVMLEVDGDPMFFSAGDYGSWSAPKLVSKYGVICSVVRLGGAQMICDNCDDYQAGCEK